ncbi:MAG: ATP-binding cassette domain-containing protein [Burkholderiaceae bacterium]|jgi:ATP-binding cassette subfamily F protein uup|nr:ATP-binding cassette domain-containing protein [Burkholderiales bacterium]MCE2646293.1 ATP-binding cassette domain-containing protein [Burkholderiaceae bacterium]
MALLTLLDAELAHGDVPLLDRAQLTLLPGERLGLIGRNGSGKSSLLQVIAGRATLDAGELQRRDGLAVVLVEQEPELPAAPTLHDSLLLRGHVPALADERRRWQVQARLAEYLQRLGVDGSLRPATASGGERKRAALALAFALEPDLLLLDEPTNHLDIGAIERLEDLVLRAPAAIVITHDRRFLDRVATRIVELDRGVLRSYPGNFAAYEQRKDEELAAEAIARRKFDKFWAQEEAWIRQGIEARRTRNEGRVARLQALRRQRQARREQQGQVKLALDAGGRSGKLVAELEHVGKGFDGKTVVRDLSLTLMRGDRLALVGPNGAGKSTLLKLIVGTLAPDSGRIRRGTQLTVAYFDQLRARLDPEKTVAETIAPGSDWIEVAGVRKHVMSYLGDFLFPPRRATAPVKTLSGGERNRLLLARLFAQPANLLVLDEPTNDLDIDTLELLEDTLQGYTGTLLLVSHDRAFLDAIATQTLAPEGDGRWREYVGGYSDWLAQRPAAAPAPAAAAAAAPAAPRERSARKLSYKEQRELDALPGEIEALEAEQQALSARMHGAEYHATAPAQMAADAQRTSELEALLHGKLERWTELEEKAKEAAAR